MEAETFDAAQPSLSETLTAAFINGDPSTVVVDHVLNSYTLLGKPAAVCALFSAVLQVAGIRDCHVDEYLLQDHENTASNLEDIFSRIDSQCSCMLLRKEAKYRKVAKTFPAFFEHLAISAFAADQLLDSPLSSALCPWLLVMSGHKMRTFRYTASVALMGLLQGTNELIKRITDSLQSQSGTREYIADQQNKQTALIAMKDHLFTHVVHQRVKDIAPEVRLGVLRHLKGWLLNFPQLYVANKYLRYLSVALHDKGAEFRAEGLDALVQILGTLPEYHSRMREFLRYFAERIVEMTADVDTKCAELAIKTAALIIHMDTEVFASEEGSCEILTNDMVDNALAALFDERRAIRRAAGIMLKVFIRSRVGHSQDAPNAAEETEMLCAFARTLRSQGHEAMPERYLVDAIWVAEKPPQMLSDYAPIITISKSSDVEDTQVGLSLLVALLLRLRGELHLGPSAKDDIKSTRMPPKPTALESQWLGALSVDVSHLLPHVSAIHGSNDEVMRSMADCIAALDCKSAFGGGDRKSHAALQELLAVLRHATQRAQLVEDDVLETYFAAWYNVTATEYPLRSDAEGIFQEFTAPVSNSLKDVEKRANQPSQSTKEGKKTLALWSQARLAASFGALALDWTILKTWFTNYFGSAKPIAIPLLGAVASTVLQSLFWQQKDAQTDAAFLQELAEIVPLLLKKSEALLDGEATEPANVAFSAQMIITIYDLLALPMVQLTTAQQNLVVTLYGQVLRHLCGHGKALQTTFNELAKQSGDGPVLEKSLSVRKLHAKFGNLGLRATCGLTRLLALKRLDASHAPPILTCWPKFTAFKPVADQLKLLFHTLRDTSEDPLEFEKSILMSAYQMCASEGASSAAIEDLYQVGAKIASVHFSQADKHYSTCLGMVRFGIEFATTTDPLVLQAVNPFCGKLHIHDALTIAGELNQNRFFVATPNPYIRTFLGTLRRVAKLGNNGELDSHPRHSKRGREAGSGSALPPGDLPSAALLASNSRILHRDGWRHRQGSDLAVDNGWTLPTTIRDMHVAVSATQESTISSTVNALADEEVFIATQEFD